MAEQILAVQKTGYALSDKDRLELLSKTRFGRRSILIEKQRNAFIERYGDPFGEVEKSGKKHCVLQKKGG